MQACGSRKRLSALRTSTDMGKEKECWHVAVFVKTEKSM